MSTQQAQTKRKQTAAATTTAEKKTKPSAFTPQELDLHNTIQDLFRFTRFYYTGGGKVINMIQDLLNMVHSSAEHDIDLKRDTDELGYLCLMRDLINERISELQPVTNNNNTAVSNEEEEEEEEDRQINQILSQRYGPRDDEDSNEDDEEEEEEQ